MERMPEGSLNVAVGPVCSLGEGPVWDAAAQQLYWVDIVKGNMHRLCTRSAEHRVLSFDEMIGAVTLCTDGSLLAALRSGLAFVDRESGSVSHLMHPEAHITANRFNDGKCDPAGRLWIGTMAVAQTPGAGALYRVGANGHASQMISGVTISNGMAWSADAKTFYYIDTPTSVVAAYDFDLASGTISNRRTVVTIPGSEGLPDGMTIDTEGMLWIAHWDGWQVGRWDPHSGKKLGSIRLPVARVTSCVFGGTDLRDLYITTARVGLTDEERAAQPLAGATFVVNNCGVQGLPANLFHV